MKVPLALTHQSESGERSEVFRRRVVALVVASVIIGTSVITARSVIQSGLLVGIFVFLGGMIVFRNRPHLVLYAAIVSIPLSQNRIETSAVNISPVNFLLVLLLALAAWRLVMGPIKLGWIEGWGAAGFFLVLVWFAYLTLTISTSTYPRLQAGFVIATGGGILAYVAVLWLARDFTRWMGLARALVLAGVIASLAALLGAVGFLPIPPAPARLSSFGIGLPRSAGFFENYGSYGILLEASLPFALFGMLDAPRRWERLMALFFLPLLAVGALLPQDRSTFLAVAAAGIMFLTFRAAALRTKGSFAIVAVLIAALLSMTGYLLDDVIEWFVLVKPASVFIRLEGFMFSLTVFGQEPWFGVGRGVFSEQFAVGKALHNTFLSMLLSSGLIGLGLFLAVLLMSVTSGVRCLLSAPDHNVRLLAAAATAAICGMVLEMQFFDGPAVKAMWIVLAIPVVLFTRVASAGGTRAAIDSRSRSPTSSPSDSSSR